jgi:methylthioribose-1-phosphate isomerase
VSILASAQDNAPDGASRIHSMSETEVFSPIRWDTGLKLLDQTLLPHEESWIDCATPEIIADAIYRLAVRGAPAIGVTAAYGLVVGLRTAAADQGLRERFTEVSDLLGSTRPTAVNLRWALERGRAVFEEHADEDDEAVIAALLDWAHELHAADVASWRSGDRRLRHRPRGDHVVVSRRQALPGVGG